MRAGCAFAMRLLALAGALLGHESSAEILPMPGEHGDPRIRLALYSENEVYRLFGFVGYGIRLEFAEGESGVLRSLVDQYLEVVASDAGDDPSHARLFPAGYRDDDDAAAEFTRYTRSGLVDRKAANAAQVSLALDEETVRLSPDAAERWLPLLTDLRLVIADRLGIRADDDEVPDTPAGEVYAWLGHLQESIIVLLEAS